MHPRRPLILATTLLAPAAAGCGTATLDAGKGEKGITKAVTEQVGAKVKSVSCPSGIKQEKGGTFTCAVTGADGTKGDATVTQKDDKGNVRFSAPFLHTKDVESAVVSGIKEQLQVDAKVACPDIVVIKAGGTFRCKATAQGQSRDVAVEQTDAKGHFSYKLA